MPQQNLAQRPYMGWSSWSFLRSKVSEETVKAQVDALFAAHLPDYGYRYINLDAGWSEGYDEHGIPKTNLAKFPSGMDSLGQYLHAKGLLFGIYMNPGIDPKLYDANPVIEGTTAHIKDITITTLPGSTHKGSYKIDFSRPAARAYIFSILRQFARWKVDFVKLDFVGPGGGNLPADNRDEVRAWHQAILATHRPIWLELSNWMSIDQAPLWRATSNGWRIENDVECYPCGRSTDPAIKGNLTIWSKVSERFNDLRPWISYAKPAAGMTWTPSRSGTATKTASHLPSVRPCSPSGPSPALRSTSAPTSPAWTPPTSPSSPIAASSPSIRPASPPPRSTSSSSTTSPSRYGSPKTATAPPLSLSSTSVPTPPPSSSTGAN